MATRKRKISKAAIVALIVVALFCVLALFDSFHREHIGPCTVTSTTLEKSEEAGGLEKSEEAGGLEKVVSTKQCGTMRVNNTLLGGSLDADDVFSQIEPGHSYMFTTQGFLAEAVHGYPNIIELLEIQL